MAKRWKCDHCGTRNEDSAIQCSGCGLIRGSVVTAGSPGAAAPAPASPPAAESSSTQWTSPAPPVEASTPSGETIPGWRAPSPDQEAAPQSTRRWRRFPLGLLFGGLVVLGVIYGWINDAGRSSSGEINKAGELSAIDLRVGDCFDIGDPTASEIDTVTARPCADSHTYEVFYLESMPAGDYPTMDSFRSFVEASCVPAFATYVGMDYQYSRLGMFAAYPTSDRWQKDDRTVQCSLYDPQNDTATGSFKGLGE